MKLYVHLATRQLGPEALDLLRFPGPPVLSKDIKCSGYWYGEGKLSRFHSENRDKLVRTLRERRLNEVEFTAQTEEAECSTDLALSPLSKLWSSPRDFRNSPPTDEKVLATYESWERALLWNQSQMPTLGDYALQLAKGGSMSDAVELVAQSIRELECDILVGSADLEGTAVNSIRNSLARWPGAFDWLGERFDGMHPILLGAVQACTSLRSALRGEFLYREISTKCQDLGIVGIPPETLAAATGDPQVLKCLVPRDNSTAPKERLPRPDKGETTLAPGSSLWLYTPARYRQLVEGNFLSSRGGWTYVPILSQRMIPLLGLDPEDVFGWIVQVPVANETDALINEAFDQLSESIPLKERILEAHAIGFRKWYPPGFGYELVMDFVRTHYFHLV